MRTKVAKPAPITALTRLLEALGQELLDASDEEIIEAAHALGMDPAMPGSAAFAGLKYPAKIQLSDFFEPDECQRLLLAPKRDAALPEPDDKGRRAKRRALAMPRKRPSER